MYKTFSVPTIDKDGNESFLSISYKISFIGSARFMATSSWNFVGNLMERIHNLKCKDFHCFVEYESVKDNLIKYKCLSCNKDYSDKIDEELNN